ncbi:MAG: cupin domain-containing protein [Humibacillus sp.]|nr:cupin domain-containing protein [Humibacillus sp.]MDN5775599.1 cupin domain-containing protein [Humibacillus sp.]
MIERAGEHAFDYPLHGGNGSIRMQWHFFDTSRLPVAVQTWELPPGASEGMHTHDPDQQPLDELYLVLAGTGRMHVDDETYEMTTGDSVLAAAGTRHDLANTGPDLLRLLVVWGEPGTTDWSGFGSAQAARRAREPRQSR